MAATITKFRYIDCIPRYYGGTAYMNGSGDEIDDFEDLGDQENMPVRIRYIKIFAVNPTQLSGYASVMVNMAGLNAFSILEYPPLCNINRTCAQAGLSGALYGDGASLAASTMMSGELDWINSFPTFHQTDEWRGCFQMPVQSQIEIKANIDMAWGILYDVIGAPSIGGMGS
jgi:hypothetical protein